MKKPQIKIPKLYPTETIEIEGNKIELRGYKPSDRPLAILIETIQQDMNPIIREVGKLQTELTSLTIDEDGKELNDEELRESGKLDRVYELTDEANTLTLKINEISDRLIYGDLENPSDEMEGPGYLLAQRGLKRFYFPGVISSELDEIEDIEIARQHVMLIANTMISLSNPPSGVQKSIEHRQRENEKAAGKGKQSKGKRTSRSKKKS